MQGSVREILVRGEEDKVVPDAQLGKKRVDRTDLHACTATGIAQSRRRDVVFAVRLNQGERGKPFDDLSLRLRTRKPL
jgi:hypothetical protein